MDVWCHLTAFGVVTTPHGAKALMLGDPTILLNQLRSTLGKMEVALGAIVDSIVWTDEDGRIQWSNTTFDRLVNRQRFEVLGTPLLDLLCLEQQNQPLTPEEHPVNRVLHERLNVTGIYEFQQAETRQVLEIYATCIQFKGQGTNAVLAIRDLTERDRLDAELRQSKQKLSLHVQQTPLAVIEWNLNFEVMDWNPAAEKIFGYSQSEVIGCHGLDLIVPVPARDQVKQVWLELLSQRGGMRSTNTNRTKDGRTIVCEWYNTPLIDQNDNLIGIASLAQDVTERKWAEEQLLHSALHDALTHLPNRALFMDRLEHAMQRAKRSAGHLFAVLFIDLDRFKLINDSLGHLIGDELLVAIARRLTACLQLGDTVARLGGDEFAVLLEDIPDLSDATQMAERIKQALALPFNLSGYEVFTTASIGIALYTPSYVQPENLLRDADIALYRAKAVGKACYEVFNLSMHAHAVERLQLETDLRRAIDRQEFQVRYQPIVALATGAIVGFEALVRWHHPQRGLVAPTEFIAVAEETGLIVPLGHWVLQEACQQVANWQVRFPFCQPLTISVNISGRQFSQTDLMTQVSQILQTTQLAPGSLKLEITETVLMENSEPAIAMLLALKTLNIQLYMDDFGTGYSSLSYLHRFPIDVLKIDRSFVTTIDTNSKNSAIVQTIITLAHNLGMQVIAEGVETAVQHTQLNQMGCEYGQGYLFSKPVSAAVITTLLSQQYHCRARQLSPHPQHQRQLSKAGKVLPGN
ncbi:bifunctional diguanylate cyclase/phosphodiesterase [Trichocoleus sp. FACHB-262]|uniref:putative bifunctional diguanylate cyclase/phosphodiesterase n=1 Tax=Trichocoleus sp. FACHB-262 TaxID=2692869 RepID=UPI0018F04925|nr:bifunctional diguanylate cyclase/phosphodiesterase [Trichocoleus sp. FACHB-262]